MKYEESDIKEMTESGMKIDNIQVIDDDDVQLKKNYVITVHGVVIGRCGNFVPNNIQVLSIPKELNEKYKFEVKAECRIEVY